VNWVPNPSRPPQELKERARRNLKEEEWQLMRDWALNQYIELKEDKYARKEQRDIAHQFYLWFQVISWTGIRPPNGSVKKNFLKWDSYEKIGRPGESKKRLFHRKDEKGHDYTATIHSQGWRYFDALEEFHKIRGTYSKNGYLFCHTHVRENTYEIGDPIANFYKQWKKMLVELELDMPQGTPQNQRLVPYSLRGYYITMRLRYGKGLSIDKLAKACGTSAKIILQTYYDFSSEKEYDELNQGFELEEDAPGVEFTADGFLIPNSLDEAML
jgi:integrase